MAIIANREQIIGITSAATGETEAAKAIRGTIAIGFGVETIGAQSIDARSIGTGTIIITPPPQTITARRRRTVALTATKLKR